ncbi:hypothetical protein [Enterococcus faecalis]|uniref:hypothetical protein n=1 Tax=Enterococcus faecalis TaxID=1351 RepID=UPI00244D8923|nr:hypothetical protein [Enterococcus faecalis]GMC12429.1 hypothetical protein L3D_18750 [Enterococcus faecalis]
MTNGTSQGLFVVIAIIIFGIFVGISYLLFRDTLKPSLSGIFTDSLEQADENLTGITNQKYLIYSNLNGDSVVGLNSKAYNSDDSIKKNFKTITLPNTIREKDLVTIDFINSRGKFKGVEKIVGNTNLTTVTSVTNDTPNLV